MNKKLSAFLLIFFIVASGYPFHIAISGEEEPFSIKEIEGFLKDGNIPREEIANLITKFGVSFEITVDNIRTLKSRGAAGKVPVFGILERDGIVKVEVVKDVSAERIMNMTIKTVRRGSIVYTDKFKCYDALMFCGYKHLRVDHAKRFSTGKVYINGLEGFWSYANAVTTCPVRNFLYF